MASRPLKRLMFGTRLSVAWRSASGPCRVRRETWICTPNLDHAQRPQVQKELEAHGFEVPAMAEELEQFGVFRSRSRNDGIFLDIFSAVGPLGQAILDRRRRITLEGRDVWLISPEDLILLKAFSDRERDFEDLVTLYRHSGSKLDKPYIEKWASSLDESIGSDEVTERIKRAQRRSLKK